MAEDPEDGLNAVNVVRDLLSLHPEIVSLTVFRPRAVPLAQERLATDEGSQSVIAAGLRMRQSYRLPFWDGVLLSCFGRGRAAYPVLAQAQFHNSVGKGEIHVNAEGWQPALWARLPEAVSPDAMLVLRSRVRLANGETRHIPMLDFHCPPSAENEELAAIAAGMLNVGGGFLLMSGESYHFYGRALLNESDLSNFLGRALLFAPIVDRAWVAHQLIEGACGLRISGKPPGGVEPQLVRSI